MKLGERDVTKLFVEILKVVMQQQQVLLDLLDIVRAGQVPPADRVAQTQDGMREVLKQLQAVHLAIVHGDSPLGTQQ